MSAAYPTDNVLDPVAIVNFAIDTGLFDIAYSAWGWPIAEIVHFTGLVLLIGTVGVVDLRMLGFFRGMPLRNLHKLIPFGVLGFMLNVLSGTVFVASSPDQYLYNPAFQIKMGLIALAGINMVLFYTTTARKLRQLGPMDRAPQAAKVFAAVSLTSWMLVIAAGRVITAFRPPAWFWCGWCS
ncbi:hypothetical protein [Alteraurantiacibacter aquimixticola]|uniref:DUF2214 family protein n=1 Tax=Alteraurantiacibacter aquimixticola TaxID=2489173 RepID=A0A4T3F2L9_9SPHN|nr:hypothetical protein [Alteraurantiacibacter aquimixticola]TIX49665.1 hypothetical protein E5222_12635 [Alteraurantiacibacter aquimixticola]